ncbi:MAG TPA: Hpt domain-containing protein, partial [Gemmatimonadales bacterium]|nr:Hpt domain-containing protein [Gemmatimonadales bacterium]
MSDERDEWDGLDATMQEYFLQLRRQYVTEGPTRLEELRQDLAACRAREAGALESLKSRFHKLAGSGGSYGFPAITGHSREAEE